MKMNARIDIKVIAVILVMAIGWETIYAAQQRKDIESVEKKLIDLSRNKWKWMAERDINHLETLFHDNAVFVHMGGTMTKNQELNIIKSGTIQYQHAAIEETTVRVVEQTAVILDKIRLTAVVNGKQVVNPFMVTEIYVLVDNEWKLLSLSFTRLLI